MSLRLGVDHRTFCKGGSISADDFLFCPCEMYALEDLFSGGVHLCQACYVNDSTLQRDIHRSGEDLFGRSTGKSCSDLCKLWKILYYERESFTSLLAIIYLSQFFWQRRSGTCSHSLRKIQDQLSEAMKLGFFTTTLLVATTFLDMAVVEGSTIDSINRVLNGDTKVGTAVNLQLSNESIVLINAVLTLSFIISI